MSYKPPWLPIERRAGRLFPDLWLSDTVPFKDVEIARVQAMGHRGRALISLLATQRKILPVMNSEHFAWEWNPWNP